MREKYDEVLKENKKLTQQVIGISDNFARITENQQILISQKNKLEETVQQLEMKNDELLEQEKRKVKVIEEEKTEPARKGFFARLFGK